MSKKTAIVLSSITILAVFLSACSVGIPALSAQSVNSLGEKLNTEIQKQLNQPAQQSSQPAQQSSQTNQGNTAIAQNNTSNLGAVAAYEDALSSIYEKVNPSVVNIRVVQNNPTTLDNSGELPNLPFGIPSIPQNPQTPNQPYAQGLGSGFVWDNQGHIITNNHVIDGADKIEVTLSDGTILPAKLVARDPDSDLAVIQVDQGKIQLQPVTMGNSDQVKVGDLAVAIGNPYGLEGTMTVGIVSEMGRSLPSDMNLDGVASYRIPDIIQTDAPINPGNSGGVLLNDAGEVIGVTFAIESNSGSSAGIGFVIPASIVNKVVPQLISSQKVSHPYLGISGLSLTPDLAAAMNLDSSQRGALIETVTQNSPADKAKIQASTKEVQLDGQTINVGGDVVTAIDGSPIKSIDDLVSYIFANTDVGQTVKLTIIRDGKTMDVSVKLEARPENTVQNANSNENQNPASQAWLGIYGTPMNAQIAGAMNLPENQNGILVVQVQPNSPAEQVGLQGGSQSVTIDGQEVQVGGDVITALDGKTIQSFDDLAQYIQQAGVGTTVTLTILRDGKTIELPVTLAGKQ
jgi:S1-C subfamily serine protease